MLASKPLIIRVAIPSPLRRSFDYLVPDSLAESPPQRGCRVSVPFGKREVVGLVIECTDSSDFALEKLKPISAIIDSQPLLPESLFKLFIWAANYYQHPIGDALFSTLPVLLRSGSELPEIEIANWRATTLGKGLGPDSLKRSPRQRALMDDLLAEPLIREDLLLETHNRAALKQLREKDLIELVMQKPEPVALNNLLREQPLTLHKSQQQAMDAIEYHGFKSFLLDGVTGSGKTEIYLQAIEKILRYGRQALILIPEISLTPQTEKRFRDRFNVPLVTLNSGLTDKARLEAWARAKSGEAQIILGTRSAIFTPLKDPGLIILDEEHDQSYKQQEGFRYSARDLAVIRAKQENIPIILGSATPSLESLNNCNQQRYQHLVLETRAGSAVPPSWALVDLKAETLECGIARSTLAAIKETISKKQQVLVFLNRRGFAPTLLCHQCGWVAECRSCDARLTVHRARGRLICHHCNYQQRNVHQCPSCQGKELIAAGEGTERSEAWLQQCFPETPVLRVDRDSTRNKGAMQKVFDTANSGEPCILVGTQMLAKGHHFANITLVVVLDADSGLFSADFRSHERMGQLLVQVAGRSGRGSSAGKVIVQTHQPQHPLLQLLINEGYSQYAKLLLDQRQLTQLPPYNQMAIIRAESNNPNQAEKFLRAARNLAETIAPPTPNLSYLGPLPALMEKRAGRFRFIFQLSGQRRADLQQLLSALCPQLERLPEARQVRWSIDVDPQEL
ncbi:MAG: primosomal protein N' [Porticoccaceae bacterium]|nr:primosomal protein N' [Porticoccaceae bacterium]